MTLILSLNIITKRDSYKLFRFCRKNHRIHIRKKIAKKLLVMRNVKKTLRIYIRKRCANYSNRTKKLFDRRNNISLITKSIITNKINSRHYFCTLIIICGPTGVFPGLESGATLWKLMKMTNR